VIIGIVTATLSLPGSRSLKDKRRVLRSVHDRVLNRMNVSVAEVGAQDRWQTAELAFVTVAAESETVQKRVADLSAMLNVVRDAVLVNLHTEWR
jgi:hypothetical protein